MSRPLSAIRFPLAAAAFLIALLAVLATLQYRWIGEVSEAEGERLRAGARRAADGVASDFNREISRALHHFGLPPGSPDEGSGIGPHIAQAAKRWKAESPFPSLVAEAFVAEREADGGLALTRVDLSTGARSHLPWPGALEPAKRSIEERSDRAGFGFGAPSRPFGPEMLEAIPAILIPDMLGPHAPGGFGRAGAERESRWAILRLDGDAAARSFLPGLVQRHFGETGEYDIAVFPRNDPGRVLYRSREGFPPGPLRAPDAEVFFFGGRSGPEPRGPGTRPPGPREREEPRGQGPGLRAGGPQPGGFGRGAWRLVAMHRSGSLPAAIAASRRKNLAVSSAILLLLAGAVATLLVSAHRAQRLARRQVEFVAGITHELRTPLAAIRAAGQNLGDGVVADPARVRQYGDLVVREGRRLSELIEQALAHAGIEAVRTARTVPVAIPPILDEAIAACGPLAQQMGTSIERDLSGRLPEVSAERSALRTLFENLITNALKYGGRDGKVLVRARENARSVEVAVSDHGPGIAASDLPHIFEPFYRGQQAAGGRVAGSGLGLSLVRRIAEALGGRIRVESAPEGGATFLVTLPAAEAGAGAAAPPEGAA